jgi:transcriptional regulator with XRE-family HTH domain
MKRKHTYPSLPAYVRSRQDKGETLQEIADDLGLSIGYLTDLKNLRQTPGFKLAKRHSIGIPLESFLEGVS